MEPILLILISCAATAALLTAVYMRWLRPAPNAESDLSKEREEITHLIAQARTELEKIAGMTADQATQQLILESEETARLKVETAAQTIINVAIEDAESRAKTIVLEAMQRNAVEYVTEATTELVPLASEDMKGRLIGREGRNIRAFEQTAGVDLIIDDTPEAVLISTFDPMRREIARQTLVELLKDGRIQPTRIEELHAKAKEAVERSAAESGREAAQRAGVLGLSQEVTEALGRLRFRTSYAQNVLDHSVEVAHLAAIIAHELKLNVDTTRRAALLHDIGKGLDSTWDGPHALAGLSFLKSCGEKDAVTHAVGAHHYEIDPQTPEAIAVIVADQISASRPGARRESLELYIARIASLEKLAAELPGVDRAFAVQAGRELRLLVRPEEVDDAQAAQLAKDIARRIEAELQYSGQVKVTVIRETRIHEVAKSH